MLSMNEIESIINKLEKEEVSQEELKTIADYLLLELKYIKFINQLNDNLYRLP